MRKFLPIIFFFALFLIPFRHAYAYAATPTCGIEIKQSTTPIVPSSFVDINISRNPVCSYDVTINGIPQTWPSTIVETALFLSNSMSIPISPPLPWGKYTIITKLKGLGLGFCDQQCAKDFEVVEPPPNLSCYTCPNDYTFSASAGRVCIKRGESQWKTGNPEPTATCNGQCNDATNTCSGVPVPSPSEAPVPSPSGTIKLPLGAPCKPSPGSSDPTCLFAKCEKVNNTEEYVCGGTNGYNISIKCNTSLDVPHLAACEKSLTQSSVVRCGDNNAGYACTNSWDVLCANISAGQTPKPENVVCENAPPPKNQPPPCTKFVEVATGADVTEKVKTGQIDVNTTSYKCATFQTGLFTIDTDPATFVKNIFGILLSISGGIALILMIYSGYRLMIARADPEKVHEARDRFASAIVGLLFILFSLVILQVIGVDILHIPGLTP